MSDLTSELFLRLKKKRWMMVTAESCTGGLIAAAITAIPGASAIFDRGFITYSNESKIEMLGVTVDTLQAYGAVSEQTALSMAEGAFARSSAHLALAVTGIAGPDGGTEKKPVGLVYIAYGLKGGEMKATKHIFTGSREDIRRQAAAFALNHSLNLLK